MATYMKIKLLKMYCNLHDTYEYFNNAYLWIFSYFDLLVFKYTLKTPFYMYNIFLYVTFFLYIFFCFKSAYNSPMSKYPKLYICMSVSQQK